MKKISPLLLLPLLLSACFFGDEPASFKKITSDFWLNWWEYKTDQHLFLGLKDDGMFGRVLIESTVFAVGYNEDFIIVKRHPNKAREIAERLNERSREERGYYLRDLADSIWLSKEDSIYQKDGLYYHTNHIHKVYDLPDSLRPDKSVTYYAIIDISHYEREWAEKSLGVYDSLSKTEFETWRKELGIPEDLDFTWVDEDLE